MAAGCRGSEFDAVLKAEVQSKLAVLAVSAVAQWLYGPPAGAEALVAQGAWGFDDPKTFRGFTHTFESSNLTTISHNYSQYGIQALYPLDWTVPRGAPCPTPIQRYGPVVKDCVTMRPDYAENWHAVFARLNKTTLRMAVSQVSS